VIFNNLQRSNEIKRGIYIKKAFFTFLPGSGCNLLFPERGKTEGIESSLLLNYFLEKIITKCLIIGGLFVKLLKCTCWNLAII